jgi:hypothetical protein
VGDAASFFNPLLAEPELVMDARGSGEFLVKWTGLDYKYCSWEGAERAHLAERLEALKGGGASVGCGAERRR